MPTYCVLCPGRDRIPLLPPVCNGCRSHLKHLPADIRDLAERFAADPDVTPDDRAYLPGPGMPRPGRPRWVERQHRMDRAERARRGITSAVLRHKLTAEGLMPPAPAPAPKRMARDQVAAVVPSTAGLSRLPVDVDRVDLLAGERPATRLLNARGVLGMDPDQGGHLSLRTALDPIVRDWAGRRRESLPPARTGPMLGWLRRRIDWACDTLDAGVLADFRDELRSYRSTLRWKLGDSEPVDRAAGVSCPSCHNWSVVRPSGSDYYECDECPLLMTEREFRDYVGWRAGVCGGCVARIEASLPMAA